jgi:ABC-type sugar transport system ATPase subunit
MAAISLGDVSKSFGSVEVIRKLSLEIDTGELVVFLGPSGSGKTTLLRMIAGLESIDAGTLTIDGVRSESLAPGQRNLALVFQNYARYTHMTVAQNMAFGLKNIRMDAATIKTRVDEAARILEMDHLLDRRPAELSGGQRQRVAIGRAIVKEPKAFLFDEPLSNLDAALRSRTRVELAELHQRLKSTMIYVTHDQVEAMTLADRIVVLNAGLIEQVGSPMELYHNPANLFVARFIGSPAMNVSQVTVASGNGDARVKSAAGATVRVPATIPASAVGSQATLGVRPEDLRLADGDDPIFRGKVLIVEKLGEVTLLYVDAGNPEDPIIAKLDGEASIERGSEVSLSAPTHCLHVFDESGKSFPRTNN